MDDEWGSEVNGEGVIRKERAQIIINITPLTKNESKMRVIFSFSKTEQAKMLNCLRLLDLIYSLSFFFSTNYSSNNVNIRLYYIIIIIISEIFIIISFYFIFSSPLRLYNK